MTPELLAALALVGLLVVSVIGLRRGARLSRLRTEAGVATDEDLEPVVRRALTALREAEQRERESELRVRELLDGLELGVLRLRDTSGIEDANIVAHRLLRRAPGTLAGLSVLEAFGDHRAEEAVLEAARVGSATRELTTVEAAARTFVLRARSSGDGFWLILHDETELRRLRRIRAEFIDNLSHELRTPLTTVRLLTETITRDIEGLEVPDRLRERIQKIDVETGHLVQMVTELLDLSRIEQGSTPLRVDAVEVPQIARASIERLRLFAERQGVSLESEFPPDLPRIRGDADRLGQLFVNLLHNAVKFSGTGGRVSVTAARDGRNVVTSVSDTGIGIPRDDLDRIFERFYKVDRARVRAGGTGLGLAIARHITESHGGRIWAESEEGRGSTFHFSLPITGPPSP